MNAVIIGGVAWNTMVYLEEFPDPVPQMVVAADLHTTVGSSGAGKALNLRTLDVDVSMWGLIGADDEGQRVMSAIRAAGIDFVVESDRAGTPRHINLMDREGRRISIFANPPSERLDVDVELMRDRMTRTDLVSITIDNHCRPFLRMAQSLGRDLWIDIHDYDGRDPHYGEFIDAADYLFMSSVSIPNWRSFLERRVERGLRAAVCTHGSDGASGLTADDGWIEIPAVPVRTIIDTNGAGDAFFAGFATAWHQETELEECLQAGARQAARAIQSIELAPELP